MNNNPLTLPKVFWRDEKYTDVLWITTPEGGGHEVWIEVEGTRWLFSSIMPMNYPAVDVSVVEISRDELAAKLHHNCAGWSAAKDDGVLSGGFLRLDEEGTILSIEQIKKVDAAYTQKLIVLHEQREKYERQQFVEKTEAARQEMLKEMQGTTIRIGLVCSEQGPTVPAVFLCCGKLRPIIEAMGEDDEDGVLENLSTADVEAFVDH